MKRRDRAEEGRRARPSSFFMVLKGWFYLTGRRRLSCHPMSYRRTMIRPGCRLTIPPSCRPMNYPNRLRDRSTLEGRDWSRCCRSCFPEWMSSLWSWSFPGWNWILDRKTTGCSFGWKIHPGCFPCLKSSLCRFEKTSCCSCSSSRRKQMSFREQTPA